MAECSDLEEGESIDWDEAVLTLDAVEAQRRGGTSTQSKSQEPLQQQQQQQTGNESTSGDFKRSIASTEEKNRAQPIPTEEEILFLYDLLDTSQYLLVNDAGHDIEDLGMIQSFRPAQRTLFNQFRKRRGFLSVTDLTAPSGWCEVQYTYGLLGRRDLKPEKRPEKIITAAGNEIKVDRKKAVAHEKILEKGRQVHAVLEREVHPEQILVKTDTKADRWGLRLLNQIVSLVTLRDAGKAREIPIFGFFEDVFVMGVMDEIEKRPLPVSEEAKKNGTSSSESPIPAAAKITHFFKSASPAVPAIKAPSYGLYLVDSKTRRMPNLPKKEYTVASRHQLMLYRYLFEAQAKDTFDWARFWSHVELKPEYTLSPSFLEQTKAICFGSGLEDMLALTTIGQMAEYLRGLHLEIGSLQEDLELVYRWRGSSNPSPRMSKKRKAMSVPPPATQVDGSGSTPVDDNDSALQAAIAASIKSQQGTATMPIDLDSAPAPVTVSLESPKTSPNPQQSQPVHSADTEPAGLLASDFAKRTSPPLDSQDKSNNSPSSTPMDVWEMANKAELVRKVEEGSIIGTEKFKYNVDKMLEYVRNTLALWNGREPKGVGLGETNKCRSCEFQDGCEWLAMKAEEHLVRTRERRMAQEAKANVNSNPVS